MNWWGRDIPLVSKSYFLNRLALSHALSLLPLLPGEEEIVLNSPLPPQGLHSLSPKFIVGSGLGSTSLQGLRISKFLGYSWSLDFYHPSILVNSERPAARNAREI